MHGAINPLKILFSFFIFTSSCLVFAPGSTAAWQSVGAIKGVVQIKPNGVILECSSRAKISVEFFDLGVVRVRVARNGVFERDFSSAIDYSHERHVPRVRFLQSPHAIVLTDSAGTKVVIKKFPFAVEIFDETGLSVVRDDPKHPTLFDKSTGEIQTTKLRQSEVETYYGFGEKAFTEMSREGKYIVNWNTDTFSYAIGTDPIYQSIPFFYALHNGRAYGLFFNNTFRTFFDMGKTGRDRYTFGADGGELDYYVFTGGKDRTPRRILEDYANLTGRTPLPPIWALGYQQSRWSYFPEKRVREIAGGFRKNKIPIDVLYLDVDYMDEYRIFTWDKKRFPDPAKMIGDLMADGFKTVLIVDPGIKVDAKYNAYLEGKRSGIFVKNPEGSELNREVWPKASAFPDFTDPKARAWFGSKLEDHLKDGIAGFWNDMNEPGVFTTETSEQPPVTHHPEKTFPDDTPHVGDGMRDSHRRYHNVYGMQMARSTFEGIKKLVPEKRPFVLTRAGFAGVQRFSAVWTGDNYASWDHLALSIPMLANLSISGVPFVGADVGGFNDMPSGELYARWLQAAALTPFLRSHSVGWVGNKEPWAFGDKFTRINRETIELRYRFLPYLYTLFREHERTGAPIMRPLWFEFPNDKSTYLINDQYMIGSDVLVAPVVKEGMRIRGIYLPAGAEWINWWTGAKLESGKTHYLEVLLDRLPVFVRVGGVVPTQSVVQHTGETRPAPITLNVADGIVRRRIERSMLFQDAGDGYGYRRNEWRQIRVTHSEDSIKLDRFGDFEVQQIRFIEIHGVSVKPGEIWADDKKLDFDYDSEKKRVRLEITGSEKEILVVR
jgi:alpha-glucosidase